jgi:hypothetical protein
VNNITLNLIEAEKKAINITIKNHFEVFELITTMLNLYIHGFNLIGKLDDKNSDTDWVWLFLTVRSFYSIRCSIELVKKAYYAQAVSLIRMVTEAYFLCGNCEKDKTIIDAVLHNIPNRPDGRTIFNYKKLAMDMDSLAIYENDYMHECNFSHTSSLSLGIMTTETNSTSWELSPVPAYNEILFIDCCELAVRNGLLMASFLEKLLNDVSKEKVNDWRIEAKPRVQQIQEWLSGLKERYGNQYENR